MFQCLSTQAPLPRCAAPACAAAWGTYSALTAFEYPCSLLCFSLHHNCCGRRCWSSSKAREPSLSPGTVHWHMQHPSLCSRELAKALNSGSWMSRSWDVPGWRDSDCGIKEKELRRVVSVVPQFPESKAGLPQSSHYCPTKQQTCQGVTWRRSMHPFLAELKLRLQTLIKTACTFSSETAISTSLHQQKYFCPLSSEWKHNISSGMPRGRQVWDYSHPINKKLAPFPALPSSSLYRWLCPSPHLSAATLSF